MWQRLTERARRAVFLAQEEAERLGDNYVSTEHLLLGVIRDDGALAVRILTRLGVSSTQIRSEIEQLTSRGAGHTGRGIQLTSRAKRVIDLAYNEARLLNSNHIATEHLLLGLIRESEGPAGILLKALGVELEAARHEIVRLQSEKGLDTPPVSDEREPTVDDVPTGTADESSQGAKPEPTAVPTPRGRWGRFSERARRIVFYAQEEAGRLGENQVTPEHLLLALLRESDTIANRVLDRLGISSSGIYAAIERNAQTAPEKLGADMQLHDRSKCVIDIAYAEASQLGHSYIGSEHFLLALIHDDGGTASRVLREANVDLERAREATIQVLDEKPD